MLSKMRACIAGAYVLAHVVMRHYGRLRQRAVVQPDPSTACGGPPPLGRGGFGGRQRGWEDVAAGKCKRTGQDLFFHPKSILKGRLFGPLQEARQENSRKKSVLTGL